MLKWPYITVYRYDYIMDSRISVSFIIIQTLSTVELGNSCVLTINIFHTEYMEKK